MTGDRRSPAIVVLASAPAHTDAIERLGCRALHVHQPGGPADVLVRPPHNYYTVDYSGSGFDRFVARVLAPLRPVAVVAGALDAVDPAAHTSSWLGVPLLSVDTLHLAVPEADGGGTPADHKGGATG